MQLRKISASDHQKTLFHAANLLKLQLKNSNISLKKSISPWQKKKTLPQQRQLHHSKLKKKTHINAKKRSTSDQTKKFTSFLQNYLVHPKLKKFTSLLHKKKSISPTTKKIYFTSKEKKTTSILQKMYFTPN